MKKLIYQMIDKEFENFLNDNREYLEDLDTNTIYNIKVLRNKGKRLYPSNILSSFFDIQYIGKREGLQNGWYIFLNGSMDKLYELADRELIM